MDNARGNEGSQREAKMKQVLLSILVVAILLLGACGAPTTQLVHYVNKELGFSIDYPEGWFLESLSPNQIRIEPEDSEYNEIHVIAYPAGAEISSIPTSLFAAQVEDGLEQFLEESGATDLTILVNEPASGKWDWEVLFAVLYGDISVKGQLSIKGTKSMYYASTYYAVVLIRRLSWPEGADVINSFRLIE